MNDTKALHIPAHIRSQGMAVAYGWLQAVLLRMDQHRLLSVEKADASFNKLNKIARLLKGNYTSYPWCHIDGWGRHKTGMTNTAAGQGNKVKRRLGVQVLPAKVVAQL